MEHWDKTGQRAETSWLFKCLIKMLIFLLTITNLRSLLATLNNK